MKNIKLVVLAIIVSNLVIMSYAQESAAGNKRPAEANIESAAKRPAIQIPGQEIPRYHVAGFYPMKISGLNFNPVRRNVNLILEHHNKEWLLRYTLFFVYLRNSYYLAWPIIVFNYELTLVEDW